MTLSPARTFRAALWRVSSADRSPNCKTGLAGDSFGPVWALTKLWNGAVHTARQCERGNTLRAVRGRRARMNQARNGLVNLGAVSCVYAHACCPPEHFRARTGFDLGYALTDACRGRLVCRVINRGENQLPLIAVTTASARSAWGLFPTVRASVSVKRSVRSLPDAKQVAGGGRRELPLNKHVESVSNQSKDVGSTPTASTNSRVAGVAPVSLVQWADLHRYSDTCRLSGATAGRDRQLASPVWRPLKDGGSNTTVPSSEELAPRCSSTFGIDCKRSGSLPMRAGTNVKSPATFAVSTPEGRGHKQDWQPGSIPDSSTTRANSGRLRLVQSRYQSRPDCNPLPSRSSRHSIVTFHPQVQQSTSIPTHKPGPAFISNRTAARTTP